MVRCIQQPLKQLSAWAASVGLLPYDPLAAWKRLLRSKRLEQRRCFTPEEMRAILAAASELNEEFVYSEFHLDHHRTGRHYYWISKMNAENPLLKPVQPSTTPLVVDLPEAAQLLGVCTETIRREINRGRLHAFKIGRVWRVRLTELNAYIKTLENQGAKHER